MDGKGDEVLESAVRQGLYAFKRCIAVRDNLGTEADPDRRQERLSLGFEQLSILEDSLKVMQTR